MSEEGRNAILLGRPGRGKTHLAIAMAYKAIQNGYEARFDTAAAMLGRLNRAQREGDLEAVLDECVAPHVLVIDELGWPAIPRAAGVGIDVCGGGGGGRLPKLHKATEHTSFHLSNFAKPGSPPMTNHEHSRSPGSKLVKRAIFTACLIGSLLSLESSVSAIQGTCPQSANVFIGPDCG